MNKRKILLITPNLKGMKGGVNRIQPSLGVGYLAAVLEQKGYEVHVRDTALEGYGRQVPLVGTNMVEIGEPEESVASYISNLKPDLVGISVLFSNLSEHAHTVARIVKGINPNIRVVLGGNHITNAVRDYGFATACSQAENIPHDLNDKNIDYAMIGESDFQFAKLAKALLNNQDPADMEGLVFRNKQGIVINKPTAKNKVDIRQLPHPARHLMNMEGYFRIGLFHSSQAYSKRVLNVMTSRGCPERCSFCTTPAMWGNNIRWRDPEDVCSEIKNGIKQYGIGEVQFEDDSLTANIQHLM
ncbi:MAG: radical SAM protein [Candidatus Omnitrophica bacterium]|nr:radical SAM protein [Candidatus Omnitrophota bacterium]